MSDFVIDASAALACVLRSQSSPASVAFVEARDHDRFLAPHIFGWEVANVLVALHRRRNLSSGAYDEALTKLDSLEIALQPALPEPAMRELGLIARRIGLSLFDAAYMILAMEHRCTLVSRDERLLHVATAENIECLDLR